MSGTPPLQIFIYAAKMRACADGTESNGLKKNDVSADEAMASPGWHDRRPLPAANVRSSKMRYT